MPVQGPAASAGRSPTAWPGRAGKSEISRSRGVIFSSNVYQSAPPELRGKAKYLRVLSIDPKTYTYWYKRPYLSTGPVVSAVQSEGVKRILGTVPIEADGSVAFHAPPGTSLHFQLLDENQRALQTMRSFVGVMPGEQRGCLGCHESHSRAPAARRRRHGAESPAARHYAAAVGRRHRELSARTSGPCSTPTAASATSGDGEGRKTLDLTPRPGFLGFDESYSILTGRPTWGQPYQAPESRRPASASPTC